MSENATCVIRNRLGMHARAAAAFVQLANRFECEVRVRKEGLDVNGKSIMGVLQLAAAQGHTIEIVVDGPQAAQAREALVALVTDRFGEEE